MEERLQSFWNGQTARLAKTRDGILPDGLAQEDAHCTADPTGGASFFLLQV